MSRYFFEIEYNGKEYFGWQKQPKEITIQQIIEDTLCKLNSNQPLSIIGCGRTDTGVHAKQYFFHSDLTIEDIQQYQFKLNSMLPSSVVVKKIFEVHESMHARFSANRRTYRYFVHFQKDAFCNDTSVFLKHSLNFDQMNQCASMLVGIKDFSSFAKTNTDVRDHICEVFEAKWEIINEQNAYFEISANRFLRNMVRAIVGTLIDVGLEKINTDEFESILQSMNRSNASMSAPSHGLFLWFVEYPFDE